VPAPTGRRPIEGRSCRQAPLAILRRLYVTSQFLRYDQVEVTKGCPVTVKQRLFNDDTREIVAN
jgi:hypothetical protein